MEDWNVSEFDTIRLGDKRLEDRARFILEKMSYSPGKTIPQAFETWGEIKACYRFFNNSLVSAEKIFAPHKKQTLNRLKQFPVVLLISDTSEIDYTTKEAMTGKERLSNKKSGLWLHPTIAVTPDRLMLGVVDVNFWHRQLEVPENTSAFKTARDNAPIEEKESYRWIQSYLEACEIAKKIPETQFIHMSDRESDIIEYFDAAINQNNCFSDFIIRSQHDRIIFSDDKTNKKLREALKETIPLGEIEFNIAPTEKRKGRQVKQQIKAMSVMLQPKGKGVDVQVNAVMAIEENPPQGEDALMWILITSLPINTFDAASKVIEYYLCRWEIELFFKVLKSGCKIEERQLESAENTKTLIVLFAVVSWSIMYAMMLGRLCPEMSCDTIFNEAQWKSVYKILHKKMPLPEKPPLLGEFMIMIATLGGYVKQAKGRPPGVKVTWKGMVRMVDFAIAWEAFGSP